MADAKGTRPRDIQPEISGPDHDKLPWPPPSPLGAGEAQRKKAAFVAGLPKRHKIENIKLARRCL